MIKIFFVLNLFRFMMCVNPVDDLMFANEKLLWIKTVLLTFAEIANNYLKIIFSINLWWTTTAKSEVYLKNCFKIFWKVFISHYIRVDKAVPSSSYTNMSIKVYKYRKKKTKTFTLCTCSSIQSLLLWLEQMHQSFLYILTNKEGEEGV